MKITSWNSQGLGNPRRILALKDLREKFPAFFLQETRVSAGKMNDLRCRSGFSRGIGVDSSGRSGGLTLWWREDYDVQIIHIQRIIFRPY